ncbi:IPT/TIG domain protein [Aquisphaera giovannonii]|uniref:IPT/TIG domain protein n=1 Tax=Aquisphaera giovannonii TaxID=406548 RepID=A0A5B9VTG0_9BACT|nr:IPT/TIG domain-containing protein [Aquisphaera giovannonii]QEH31592.1 IPT/TIG domain protein [Aquisphaera giovannonii]
MTSTTRRPSPHSRPGRPATGRRALPRVDALESRQLLTLLGQQLFPSDNAWNQNVSAAPVASNSAAIINNIIGRYGDGRFHPDFGQDYRGGNPLYGIPFNVVHGNSQPKVRVVVDGYPDESDLMDAPIPANAVLEGDKQNGPVAGLANRGDSHLIVWDVDNDVAYEFYNASRPGENADGRWHAAQESVWDMKTDTFRPLGWTSADAAGLAILPGLVRPDEALPASQGGQGVINHAIRITLQNSTILNKYVYPASHVANTGTDASVLAPMGARLRLKANVDISGLNPQSKVVAQAMKDYGVIVADNGSNFYASGASYSVDAGNNFTLTWSDADIQDSTRGLKSLTFSDFEVVDTTPVVTGLSASSGSAGATVTVAGLNFSGAAGRLSVLFGGVAATSVTVVDDSHVTAVVPAGTGTVDVRVQSGVTASDARNIKNPVFGYGTSAVTAADRFTYGGTTGPTAAAAFVGTDTTDQGNWRKAFGADGYNIAGDSGAANPKLPSYATLAVNGASTYVWAASTTDPRALQNAANTGRVAGTFYSSKAFSLDLNLTDGKAHQVSLYALDWDLRGRTETIQVVDAGTGTVLDTRALSGFQNGKYLTWNLSGHVLIRVTNTGPSNAVVGGLFFGAAPAASGASATFLGTDSTTAGSWRGVYGADGYNIAQDASAGNPKRPSYATVGLSNALNYTWAASTTDTRALRNSANTGRLAATWYGGGSFSINVNLTDGQAHKVSLYAVDWDNQGRNETIQIIDNATGNVLNTQTVSGFRGGKYLSWSIKGNVTIKVTRVSGPNAVVSGLFFN